ncbi:type III secretion system effector XopP [Ralstonia nicotianae]|uniref:Type III effector protein hlk1 n=1 Tax=Ralstonia nicotianae TaxID=3037696 RepID=A0ABX7ZTX8_9RALS|nr:type III secretion system effector XopP [Ralstonia nicotianae]QUP58766.1 type III effector protein hlk1 [Ralstonia nicotianae]
MAGGRVGARAVRESAQTPVSADASTSTSTSTSAAASPPVVAGRQAARPAELRGLASAPSSRASSSSTGGLSRQASLPARAVARETPEAPVDVFNRTMRHVNAWRAVAERERKLEALGPEHKGLSPEREMRYACDAIASIQTCLQALAAMKRQQEIPPGWDVDGREAELLQLLIVAADIGVCTRHETLNKLADQDAVFRAQRSGTAEAETVSGPDGPRPDTIEEPEPAGATAPSPSEHTAISPLSALEREPGTIQAWLAEFTSCRSALDQIIRRAEVCGAPRTVQTALDTMLPNAIYDKLRCCSGLQALHGILAAASANRFVELSRQMALPDLAVRADELLAAWHKENAAMEAAVDALVVHGAPDKPTQRLTPKALDGHQAVIEAYAEGLDRVGLNLCLDAAADIEMDDADGVWRSMMEVVHAISAYKASLLELSETAGRAKTQPEAPQPEPESSEAAPEPALSEPPPAARPAGASGGTRRKHRKPGMRAAGPSVPEPVSARALVSADTRTVAQKQADTLLRRCRIDRATVAQLGGNIVELAQRLGEDTRLVLSALNDRTRDAVIAAKFIWGSVGRWFGEPDRVRSAKASLHAGDHDRIGRLTNWLGALELIERHMAPLEADMLKRDRYPKAKHLEKLLQAKGIEFVGGPGRLPPTEDVNAVGTLFGMRIQFKPLSNRDQVAPWFVHLHTNRPVTAQALPTLAFEDFTAVHLKTDRDKNKGAQWEAAMRALGYTEAKVHRAAIGEALLHKLFAQAAKQPKRNKGGVRPAG